MPQSQVHKAVTRSSSVSLRASTYQRSCSFGPARTSSLGHGQPAAVRRSAFCASGSRSYLDQPEASNGAARFGPTDGLAKRRHRVRRLPACGLGLQLPGLAHRPGAPPSCPSRKRAALCLGEAGGHQVGEANGPARPSRPRSARLAAPPARRRPRVDEARWRGAAPWLRVLRRTRAGAVSSADERAWETGLRCPGSRNHTAASTSNRRHLDHFAGSTQTAEGAKPRRTTGNFQLGQLQRWAGPGDVPTTTNAQPWRFPAGTHTARSSWPSSDHRTSAASWFLPPSANRHNQQGLS